MFVNTGGGGKTQQQQQTLQSQANASVRHSNPYPITHTHTHTHTQQQPHYEHQAPITFVPYSFCNVAPSTHAASTGGNGVGVGAGQPGHVLYQTSHQVPQSQPHHTQQVGLHNPEQTLHYFTKGAPMPAHSMHHPAQQHSQIRNMIAVSHQRQQFMVSPNYFALSHAILPQQTRTSLLTNAAPQHAVSATSGGSMATQLQNTTPRNVAPSGPTAYIAPPYCTPPLLLGAGSTSVTPQATPLLTSATGMPQAQTLQAYAHMGGGMATTSTSATAINMPPVGLGVGVSSSSNTDHSTNTNTKERKHAIPIINPDTLEEVTVEPQTQLKTQPEMRIQLEIKKELNVESVSIQTDNDKSLTVSIASEPSDAVITPHSHSISATQDSDKTDQQYQTNCGNYTDNVINEASFVEVEASIPLEHINTQSPQSDSECNKICIYDDANDTDADANEQELDNEDDILDTADENLTEVSFEPELPEALAKEEEEPGEIPITDTALIQTVDSYSDHSTETEVKSKDEPCSISMQNSLEEKEFKCKEIQENVQPTASASVVNESKRGKKNKKAPKRKEKTEKKPKKQQNKNNNNSSTQSKVHCNKEEKIHSLKTSVSDDKEQEFKKPTEEHTEEPTEEHTEELTEEPIEETAEEPTEELTAEPTEEMQHRFLRYSLEELKSFGISPESCKTPVVRCHKGDCISQLFVARQQHHLYHLPHQIGQSLNTASSSQHVQQSYHQMNFNESMEFITGKRRAGGNVGGASASLGSAVNANHMQKKMQVIRINLSLNEEIKLSKSKNAWQPKCLTSTSNNQSPTSDQAKEDNDIEDVLKKVRGILNKLTSENFDVLLKEMTTITINTQEKMKKVMLLIFEKTVSEPNFAPTYAKFSKVLFEEVKAESKKAFNVLLIKRLQTEFELNVNNADAKERKLQQIMKKLNETTDPQQKIEIQAELENEEYQFRRRAWGTVRFIGEMYKLHSLTANNVLECVESLLEHGNEEKLEYMCKLLTTVGSLLESTDSESSNNKARMNKIFTKIQTIVKEARQHPKKIKICSRVRFMLQDLIDLRSKNWGQSPNLQSSQLSLRRRQPEDRNSNLSSASLNSYDRGSSQRMSFGNNNRHNQTRPKDNAGGGGGGGGGAGGSNYFTQKPLKSQYLVQREQHSIDLKKLPFSRGEENSQSSTELGNKSMYQMRRFIPVRQGHAISDSQQSGRTSPASLTQNTSNQYQQKQTQLQRPQCWGGNKSQNSNSDIKGIKSFYSSKESQKLVNCLIEEYLDCQSRNKRWQEDVLNTWQNTNNKQQICLIYHILMDYLHLSSVKRLGRSACANIFIYIMGCKAFNKTTFSKAYEQFVEDFPDLLMDVPNGWTYVFEFLGPILHERLLSLCDIWHDSWRSDEHFTKRFVNALVVYFTSEFGANYVRELWHKDFELDNGQLFMDDQQQWRQFLTANKLQFLYDSKIKPEISTLNCNNNNNNNNNSNNSEIVDQHMQRLQILLTSPNDSNLALDYINTNVNINSCFLTNLTRFLCCDYATMEPPVTSRASSITTSKNSSTCSNTGSSSNCSTKFAELSSNSNNIQKAHLNIKAFRNNCLPLLRFCLDGNENHELTCLDSIVDALQKEYDANTANELICGIFDILYDCEVIAKESFEKWYTQCQQQQQQQQQGQKKSSAVAVNSTTQSKRTLSAVLETYLQNLL